MLSVPFRICREWLGEPVPAEHAEGFARAVAYTNWRHALALTVVAIATNVLVGLVPEYFYYRTGHWAADTSHRVLTGLHLFMTLVSVAAVVVLRRDRPAGPAAGARRHQRLALGYCAVMLAAVTAFSAVEQRLTGSISAYLLGIAVFAMLFHTGARVSLAILGASYLGLLGGSLALQPGFAVWHHLFVGFDAVIVFWIGSRVVFSLKAANYLQLVTITEQAHALAEANRELARAHEFKSDLLALAGHDLRDPLNSISLCVQTLRDELAGNAEAKSLVLAIDESVRHMNRFVLNLLTDAAADAREIVLERSPVELPRLVADVVSRGHVAADAKAIPIRLSVDDSALRAPHARVDPARVRQIVENLLSNAVKFSPPGSQVSVELSYDASAGGHRLAVCDEGPGLSAEDLSRIFSKFRRLSARPTAGESSTGLGLFIVKTLVALHGGEVWAESEGLGKGTRFIVTLS